MALVLAIDPGLTHTGFAVLEESGTGRRIEVIHLSTINFAKPLGNAPSAESIRRRCDEICMRALDVTGACKPDLVAIELWRVMGPRTSTSWPTAVLCGCLSQAVTCVCPIPSVVFYFVHDWRKLLCGKRVGGGYSDACVSKAVERVFGEMPAKTSIHTRDAIGLGIVALRDRKKYVP